MKAVERRYPGTGMVFKDGPHFSHLWEALTGDPRHALMQIETVWRNGVHVEHGLDGSGRYVQDLVVPEKLASRWNLTPGLRLNLGEKRQPWEHLNDVCAQLVEPGFCEIYAGGGVLTLAPSATFTKEERLKTWSKLRLPFFAGLSYRIAQARVKGENSLTLNLVAGPRITSSFAGWFLEQLLAKLPDKAGFKIVLEGELFTQPPNSNVR
ncbi:MAG: hypothetical protein O7C67_11875 [Gammaproteobacteria bacterium]|nr:hypothetical protein [Gammaproteobacteria bacterium]